MRVFEEKKDLTIEIDLDDLDSEIRKLKLFEDQIYPAVYRGLNKCSEQIIKKLQNNMDKYGVPSLKDAILIEYSPESFFIKVEKIDSFNGENYAGYVEFGTGITGAWSPHPEPWAYDVNNHGYKGWYYETADGYEWTRGMPARPYMYDTVQWIKSYSPIKRAILKELRKLSK